MIRAAQLRGAVAAEAVELVDLSSTPWRRIWLSPRQNVWTLVDAVDFDWLSEHVWNVWHAGRDRRDDHMLYAKRNEGRDRATVRMHREILIRAEPPPPTIAEQFLRTHVGHHRNSQTLDNRRANLEWVTRLQNNQPAARRARGHAASLEQVVRELVAGLPALPQLEEVPFP